MEWGDRKDEENDSPSARHTLCDLARMRNVYIIALLLCLQGAFLIMTAEVF